MQHQFHRNILILLNSVVSYWKSGTIPGMHDKWLETISFNSILVLAQDTLPSGRRRRQSTGGRRHAIPFKQRRNQRPYQSVPSSHPHHFPSGAGSPPLRQFAANARRERLSIGMHDVPMFVPVLTSRCRCQWTVFSVQSKGDSFL